MSNGNGGDNGEKRRGPPQDVREKIRSVNRGASGELSVSDDALAELASNVNWNNLSPFEEYVLAVLDENDLLHE